MVARRAHNPKVVGSNPAPATNLIALFSLWMFRAQLLLPTKVVASVVNSNPSPATNLLILVIITTLSFF